MIIGILFLAILIIVTSVNFKYKMKKQLTEADKEVILDHIANAAICEPSDIYEKTRLEQDLTLDSLDIVELIMSIEREFNICISDNDIENCKTVSDLFMLVSEQL